MKGIPRLAATRKMHHRQIFRRFAAKIGLVYFGYVDQRDDDHRLIRGLMLSPTSRDDHYCIGTYKGYDIMCAERSDTIKHKDGSSRKYVWNVVVVDLHRGRWPHIVVGHNSRRAAIAAKFTTLMPIYSEINGPHRPDFHEHFTIYTRPDHAVDVQQMFRPELTAMIADHFADMSIEITAGSVYVYSEQHLSAQLLERMTMNGIWLAQLLDTPGLISTD